jgi:hypothetical protein
MFDCPTVSVTAWHRRTSRLCLGLSRHALRHRRLTPARAKAPAPAKYANDIRALGALLDEGLITEDEFRAKKKQLLGL